VQIGTKMSEMLLDGHKLNFYGYGDHVLGSDPSYMKELLQVVKDSLDVVAEVRVASTRLAASSRAMVGGTLLTGFALAARRGGRGNRKSTAWKRQRCLSRCRGRFFAHCS
jgi:hypothetical protein